MNEIVPQDPANEDDSSDEDEFEDPKKMGFLDHLEELRWSLLKPLVVFMIAFALSMVFIKDVKDVLLYPLLGTATDAERAAFEGLATRNVTGVYSAMLQIGLIIGVGVASPFLVYYLGKFLSPALTRREKRVLIPGSLGVLALFLLGCSFSFFLLLPKAIEVTTAFNEMMGFQMIWAPDSYFEFITWIILGMGIAFQFPLITLVLVYLEVVSLEKLRSMRRVFILAFFIIAAILTPPDPVTQTMMAIPMILLYELSLIIGKFLLRKRRAGQRAEEMAAERS